jgi:hypothetical protein
MGTISGDSYLHLENLPAGDYSLKFISDQSLEKTRTGK